MRLAPWAALVLAMLGCTGSVPVKRTYDVDFGAIKRTQAGQYRIGVELVPGPPPLGELFQVHATVQFKDGMPLETAVVRLDARMPQHDHGMETRPRVREGVCEEPEDTDTPVRRCRHPDGVYIADGFKFHMSGDWTITAEIDGPRGMDSTDFVVTMP